MTEPTSAPPAPAASRMTLLRDSRFRRIWLAGFVNDGMRWLELLATSVYVFQVTGSALTVALVQMARMLPNMVVGSLTGTLAERMNRKTLLLAGLAIQSVVTAVLTGLAVADILEIWHIAAGAVASGLVFTTEFPVRRNMLGEIAGIENVGTAMGLDSVTRNSTRVVGPALGGFLVQFVGIEGAYFLASALFAVSFAILMPLAYKSVRASEEGRKFLENLLDGFRYVRSHRGIVATLLVTVVMNVWGFVYMAMVPAIGEGSLGLSAFPIGVLVAAEGVGAMLGALWLAFYGQPRYYTKYYFFGPVIFFVAILLFANSHIFVVSLIILLIGGFGMAGFSTMQSTIPFLQSDPAMRARVMGLLSVSIGSGPVGMLHVGLLANTFGATTAVTIIAVEGLIALALVYVLWPEAR